MESRHIVAKVTDRAALPGPDVAPARDQPIEVRLTARLLEAERKEALVVQRVPKGSEWRLVSDEGPGIGGADAAPEPLSYFGAAVAF